MKRRELIRQLKDAECVLKRHGHLHDLYTNPSTGRSAPVPRHTEIADTLCKVIRKQLEIGTS